MANTFFRATQKGFTPLQTAQLQASVKRQVEAMQDECLNKGFIFSMMVCLGVLQADEYFGDKAKELLPSFIKDVLSDWESLDLNLLTMTDISNEIFNLTGIRIHPEYFDRADKSCDDMVETSLKTVM